jgi:hypothetical protein
MVDPISKRQLQRFAKAYYGRQRHTSPSPSLGAPLLSPS